MVAAASHPENSNPKMKSAANKQTPPVNVTPSPSQRNQKDECNESLLESAVKNIFGPCVGAIDVASCIIQSTCGGDEETKIAKTDVSVLGMKLKRPAPNQRVKRRQGETLEFPANDGFDDDVSAISAHTLEEMERLHLFNKNNKNGRVARNGPKKPDLDWTYQVKRPVSTSSNNSLGVSTSGSASSVEADQHFRLHKGPTSGTRSSRLIDI
jgi:hypothetical protein